MEELIREDARMLVDSGGFTWEQAYSIAEENYRRQIDESSEVI